MRFTVLRSKAVHVTDEHQFPLENYMLQHVNGTTKPKYTVFPDFLSAKIIDVFYGKASPLSLTAYPFLISQATNKWCSFDIYTYNTVEPRLTATSLLRPLFVAARQTAIYFLVKKITLVTS